MYNIEVLAKLTELTKRTIRYYIEIGLLTPPIGNCRASYYTDCHLKRLDQIKTWSEQGIPLNQMKSIISAETHILDYELVIDNWSRLDICDDVELSFKSEKFDLEDLKKISLFIREVLQCSKDRNKT